MGTTDVLAGAIALIERGYCTIAGMFQTRRT
jgi:hypothetical protein